MPKENVKEYHQAYMLTNLVFQMDRTGRASTAGTFDLFWFDFGK